MSRNFLSTRDDKNQLFARHFSFQPQVTCVDDSSDQISKYLMDPSFIMTGPMKFELMTPHVDKHGIYRIRRIPGESNGYFLELHKKSVYNNCGNYKFFLVFVNNFHPQKRKRLV